MAKDAEVVTADNGVDGLERALEGGFDLILLDMLMPRMSGIDMLRELRAREGDGSGPPCSYCPIPRKWEAATSPIASALPATW